MQQKSKIGKKEDKIKELQRRFFGKRYEGACLSELFLPEGSDGQIFKWIQEGANFLVLCGAAGTSKTYFCSAMMEYLFKQPATFRAYSERDLFMRVRKSIKEGNGDYLDFLIKLIDDHIIILDDVGSSGHTDWREEVLMETVDFRYREMLPTIVTSNLTKKDFIEIYGQRITSRLFAKENTIIDLSGMPDLRSEGK